MKEIIKLGMTLLLVTAIAGASLSLVNNITKPEIEKRKIQATKDALTAALPAAAHGVIEPNTSATTIQYYIGYRDTMKQELIGYAFLAKENGYSSEIETMVGVDTSGAIVGLKILRQLETPGLGTKIEEVSHGATVPFFQAQFIDKKVNQLAVDKDGGKIVSITGATISSRAVTNSIKKGIQQLDQEIGGFKK